MHRRVPPFLAIVATVALAACGGAATPTPAASAATQPSVAASAPAASAAASQAGASQAAAGSPAGAAACAVAPAGATATVNVSIKNFSFSPQPVQAKVGDTVAWKNEDSAPHSATMDDNSCDTDTISAGAAAMLVFTAPGTYTYHCKIHPGQMKGFTVEVK